MYRGGDNVQIRHGRVRLDGWSGEGMGGIGGMPEVRLLGTGIQMTGDGLVALGGADEGGGIVGRD